MRLDKIILALLLIVIISSISYTAFLVIDFNNKNENLKPADGKLIYAFITPHPPLIIPQVGAANTLLAMKTAISMYFISKKIKKENPGTIIIITPHSIMHPKKFSTYTSPQVFGDLSRFSTNDVKLTLNTDREFISKLKTNLKGTKLELNELSSCVLLDHGSFIPAYFLYKTGYQGKYVIINQSELSMQKHIELGKNIRKTINQSKGKYVLIASGDLSHRLYPDSPEGYSPNGKVFDQVITKVIKNGNYKNLDKINPALINEAGQCSLNSILVGIGAINGQPLNNIVFSYESPFGVGYLVGSL